MATSSKASAVAMESRASKLVKLDDFKRSLPFITATALAAVVDKIKTEGAPDLSNRKDIKDAALQALLGTAYGPVLTKVPVTNKDGSTRDFVFANPIALLQAAYAQGGAYYTLAMLALVNVIELVQATSMVPGIAPEHVDNAVDLFFSAVKAADWEDLAHSKFHWLCHFGSHQQKLSFLPSCFCHERKHKQVKKYLSNTFNTQGYEFSILKELCAEDLHHLRQSDVFATHARLKTRSKASKKFASLLQGHLAFRQLYTCSVAYLQPAGIACKGDYILFGESLNAGEVLFHCEIDSEVLTLVKHFDFQGYDKATCSAKWLKLEQSGFVETQAIKTALAYQDLPNGIVVGLVPLAYRPQ
eukprot:Skav224615  [mRNA]  locus=scaffold2059:635:2800:- [translate_table: standard]